LFCKFAQSLDSTLALLGLPEFIEGTGFDFDLAESALKSKTLGDVPLEFSCFDLLDES
jgi:hypothetical protein